MRSHAASVLVVVSVLACLGGPPLLTRLAAQELPLELAERFALADDRAAVLDTLVPGSAAEVYHRCLLLQQQGELHAVDEALAAWVAVHSRSQWVAMFENRQALLRYGLEPDATWAHLRERIKPFFDHQRVLPGQSPDRPSRLDPGLLDPEALRQRALGEHRRTLAGFRDEALPALVGTPLDDDQLRHLLARLRRADLPGLVDLVLRELALPRSGGFGSLGVHERLLLDQLHALRARRPELGGDARWVSLVLARMTPGPDVDLVRDPVARQAHLDALWGFARSLPASFNSLKAHVLFHRLSHDRGQGTFDEARFREYLALPLGGGRRNPEPLKRLGGGVAVDAAAAFATGFPPIGDESALVDACLERAFRDGADWRAYTDWLLADHLRRVYAETRILYGLGDPQEWAAQLDDPAAFERLRERVEITFAPEQRTLFGAREAVTLDVDLKHVDTLLVRVFELDAFGWYSQALAEPDASIALDGLVANEETTHRYDDNPLRRVRRRFEFPELSDPGLYVVEFLGNGVASRAVVRKGALHLAQRVGAAGHVVAVLDDDGSPLPDAALWLDGRLFAADGDGEILVPFSTEGGSKPVVLVHGERASLATLDHEEESYSLTCGVFVEREQLLARGTARVLLRPALRVNGRPASLALLEQGLLVVTSVDRDGNEARLEVREPAFEDGADFVQEVAVPDDLRSLRVVLTARVRSLSEDEHQALAAAPVDFAVNAIDDTPHVAAAMLGRGPEGFWLELRGKAGEPLPGRPVTVLLRHRDVTDDLESALASDDAGRLWLGPLPGVTHVTLRGVELAHDTWELQHDARDWPERLTGVVGELLRVPSVGAATEPTRTTHSLVELRDGVPAVDRFEHLGLSDGFVVLRDLPAGRYRLSMPRADAVIDVRVLPGERTGDWLVSPGAVLPAEGTEPLHITRLEADDEALVVQLANVGPDARVAVLATRWLPTFDPFLSLLAPPERGRDDVDLSPPIGELRAGRVLDAEFRYVLERRFTAAFPGNMLRRPSLLLNPWALDEAPSFSSASGASVGGFYREKGRNRGKSAGVPTGGREPSPSHPGRYANLDFLPEPAVLLANLRPDAAGRVRVSRADLGPGGMLSVLALDDTHTVSASLVLPEQPFTPRNVSLARPIDGARHVAEQRRIEHLPAGATAVIEDVTTSEVASLDSLAAVYRVFGALGGAPDLPRFDFLVRWPELDREEKLAKYDEFACHELHLFLHQHDRAFFDEVVRPYLANKLHKRFLDQWLLGDDVSRWLEPWRFEQLNAAERVLLARRLPEHAGAITRLAREAVARNPMHPVERRRRFDAALRGGALDGGPGLAGAVREAAEALAALGYLGDDADQEMAEVVDAPMPSDGAVARAGRVAGSPGLLTGRGLKLAKDRELRAQSRALYRGPDATREWIESDYWHLRPDQVHPGLVPPNAFWLDLALADPDAPFVSPHVVDATASLTEMLLALAVLDLPFTAGEHETTVDGARLSLRAASPLLLVRQELRDAEPLSDAPALLVDQQLYRLDERYVFEDGRRRDRFVGDELLAGVPYGCQVVLTNPSSSRLDLELLLQVPEGALPVQGGFRTRGLDVELGPYATSNFTYAFYLPSPGNSRLYPAHVSLGGELVAAAAPRTLRVVREPSTVDTGSWAWVSQQGSLQHVLDWLEAHDPDEFSLADVAWRLRDRAAFDAIVGALRGRQRYDTTVWSYGLYHEDERTAREYLEREPGFAEQCGRVLDSPLLTLEPVERLDDLHVEFEPLFNARAHRFGGEAGLDNPSQEARWADLLAVLAERPALTAEDRLRVVYHLVLQDRVADALEQFARIDADEVSTRLQVEYLAAYLAMSRADVTAARAIAERHRSHPVPRWRARFAEVLAQLDEAEGRAPSGGDATDRTRQLTDLADEEPELSLLVEAGVVRVFHRNLTRCELRYTETDIEFLFSGSPFVGDDAKGLPPIRPTRRDVLELAAEGGTLTVPLPDELQGRNVVVEVRGGGLVDRQTHTASRLDVRLIESYGQLVVTHADNGAPLRAVYVKVYARLAGGAAVFHKDGYTDLRGRFDYASLSAEHEQRPERFAILVLSADDGAVVREVDAPVR